MCRRASFVSFCWRAIDAYLVDVHVFRVFFARNVHDEDFLQVHEEGAASFPHAVARLVPLFLCLVGASSSAIFTVSRQ